MALGKQQAGEHRWVIAANVVLIALMSTLLPALKGNSLTKPALDTKACEEAAAVGASCELCTSKFKMCRGHHTYEPFSVVLLEAFLTICVGVLLTFRAAPPREAMRMLLDWGAWRRVAPIGATYGLGDVMDLFAAKAVSGSTLQIASQMRLPLCAFMRSVILGRSQTLSQWLVLLSISCFCIVVISMDVGSGKSLLTPFAGDGLLWTFPLLLGKCFISCAGAVHAEHFLQHKDARNIPLWVTQVHFKFATMLGTLLIGAAQGRKGRRILASQWHGGLFEQLPPGVNVGDARTPFFGGWDLATWMLVAALVFNNFAIGDSLRRLSSVSKYVAYALGMVVGYCFSLIVSESHSVDFLQASCYSGIALLAIGYVCLPAPPPPRQQVSSGTKED